MPPEGIAGDRHDTRDRFVLAPELSPLLSEDHGAELREAYGQRITGALTGTHPGHHLAQILAVDEPAWARPPARGDEARPGIRRDGRPLGGLHLHVEVDA